jgi:hypothetical protein
MPTLFHRAFALLLASAAIVLFLGLRNPEPKLREAVSHRICYTEVRIDAQGNTTCE